METDPSGFRVHDPLFLTSQESGLQLRQPHKIHATVDTVVNRTAYQLTPMSQSGVVICVQLVHQLLFPARLENHAIIVHNGVRIGMNPAKSHLESGLEMLKLKWNMTLCYWGIGISLSSLKG